MASNGKSQSNNGLEHAEKEVVAILVPLPAQGHLNPFLHLARLIESHNIPVHFVGTITHIRQVTHRYHSSTANSNIHFHRFEVPPIVSPPPNLNDNAESNGFPSHLLPFFDATFQLREPFRELLQSLSSQAKRVVVIHDAVMAYVAQDATHMPNVENYTFHSSCAFYTALRLWEEIGRPKGLHVPEPIPSREGCFPRRFGDFMNAQSEFHQFSDGIIFNTNRAIEGDYIEFVEGVNGGKKVWALWPFKSLAVEKKDSEGVRHSCVEWLDKQEANSVIYVSFGSTTTLTEEQIQELARGLEQSKQKFIWVLRDADKVDIFDCNAAKRHDLPTGFEERVEGMGLVVRDWAPQLEILSHSSTGGFMSHCGWNSCLESLTMGKPIAAWPVHCDQPRNTILITQVLKVGLVVKDWAKRNVVVSASVVENAVRRLMETKEGDEMRERAVRLKNAIHRSMDEGAVTSTEVDAFIAHITK
ncbi:zeatin O-glucosyltransferase-like [Vigna unguiculata]|uniref:Glycosyltransferase n=1 Tax=Vigna unguiculata TaxID=3917 RepID=A0A4D6NG80_VIGUN|nr:zeatin O-glucosyltransferase-like [Vigna unguiculata]QCE11912.1 cis-zeatin O-glucosyltransferase [Vigna unguiculata]